MITYEPLDRPLGKLCPIGAQLGHNFVLQMCPDRAGNLFGCGLFACSSLSITSLCPSLTCLWRIGTVPATLQRHVRCVTPRKQQFASHTSAQEATRVPRFPRVSKTCRMLRGTRVCAPRVYSGFRWNACPRNSTGPALVSLPVTR